MSNDSFDQFPQHRMSHGRILSEAEVTDTEWFSALEDGVLNAEDIPAESWMRVGELLGLEELVLQTIEPKKREILLDLSEGMEKDWALNLLRIAQPAFSESFSRHHQALGVLAYATAAGDSVELELVVPIVFVSRVVAFDSMSKSSLRMTLYLPPGKLVQADSALFVFENEIPVNRNDLEVSRTEVSITFEVGFESWKQWDKSWKLLAISTDEQVFNDSKGDYHLYAVKASVSRDFSPSTSTLESDLLLQSWGLECERLPDWAFLAWCKEAFGSQRRLLQDEAEPAFEAAGMISAVLDRLRSLDRVLEGYQQEMDNRMADWFKDTLA